MQVECTNQGRETNLEELLEGSIACQNDATIDRRYYTLVATGSRYSGKVGIDICFLHGKLVELDNTSAVTGIL